MMAPHEWITALAEDVHWNVAYETVEREVRALLTSRADRDIGDFNLSTTQVVAAFLPAELKGGGYIVARKRFYKGLAVLATRSLGDCATRGPEIRSRYGVAARPWLWHAPRTLNPEAKENQERAEQRVVCPHCGGNLV